MKQLTYKIIFVMPLSLNTGATIINATEIKPLVYLNKNIGFNIEGYNYQQPALPCDTDKKLVGLLKKKGDTQG